MMTALMMKIGITWNEINELTFHEFRTINNSLIKIQKEIYGENNQ